MTVEECPSGNIKLIMVGTRWGNIDHHPFRRFYEQGGGSLDDDTLLDSHMGIVSLHLVLPRSCQYDNE